MTRLKLLLLAGSMATFLSACVHYESDLVREGQVDIKIIPPKVMVKISDVRVQRKDDGVAVMGYVKRTGLGIMHGHVDITILSPQDTVLGKASTKYSPSFNQRYGRRRQVRPSYFYAKFPNSLPLDFVARVAFHPEKLGDILNCGNNQAQPLSV